MVIEILTVHVDAQGFLPNEEETIPEEIFVQPV